VDRRRRRGESPFPVLLFVAWSCVSYMDFERTAANYRKWRYENQGALWTKVSCHQFMRLCADLRPKYLGA
jgi:hypothetical protein